VLRSHQPVQLRSDTPAHAEMKRDEIIAARNADCSCMMIGLHFRTVNQSRAFVMENIVMSVTAHPGQVCTDWLVPWRWPRWRLWTCAVWCALSPVVYLVSVAPVVYLMFAAGYDEPEQNEWFRIAYTPVFVLYDKSPHFEALCGTLIPLELEAIANTFGEPAEGVYLKSSR
jgi:hypothetical protein